jgi:hypothetical protein
MCSTDAFGPTRTPGNNNNQRYQTTTTSYESRPSTYEMQERGYTSQNVVASAANTDLSTMDGYLAEVKIIYKGIELVVVRSC